MQSKITSLKKKEKFPPLENRRKNSTRPYPVLDSSTSHTMIYITNYELRDYQLQMATASVHYNTLISIPTGLGKTFIGAVLIANFHRWFPTGQIIFTAPTRPLLIQQMNEIQKILKLQDSDYSEISGSIDPIKRKPKWQKCKIFFGTPQAIQNDIESGICDASQIVLIVIDEAHRAHGDYSYCKIISLVASITSFFRVVGLTATPGNYFTNVQDLIYNLLIEKIESDTCEKYKYKRNIEKIIIQKEPGFDILKNKLNEMLMPLLIKMYEERMTNITDPEKITKGSVAMWNKQVQSKQSRFTISKMLRILGLREKLEEYSISIFEKYLCEDGGNDLKSLKETSAKFLKQDKKMEKLKEIVRNYLSNSSSISSPNSSSNDEEKEYSPLSCRQIIIFSNYRLVVEEIVKNLCEMKVACAAFVGQSQSGQSKGLNRSKQLKVVDLFKKKLISVLVSTSIGEEGLDIGEVDLIICYDVQKSLTRMIQRIGRTGRKRNGNVIFLLNEESKYNVSSETSNYDNDENSYFESFADNFLQSNKRFFDMFSGAQKMIPENLKVIYKKIDESMNIENESDNDKNQNKIISQNNSSAYLSEEEKYYMKGQFGISLKYSGLKVFFDNKIINKKYVSTESRILDLIINKQDKVERSEDIEYGKDDFFQISSGSNEDDSSVSSDFSSFPTFMSINQPVEFSFLDNHNNKKKNYINVYDNHDNKSPEGFSQIINRKSQIKADVIDNYEEECYYFEDYSDSIIIESESFVSTSSECICYSTDEYEEEILDSPTFVSMIISSKT